MPILLCYVKVARFLFTAASNATRCLRLALQNRQMAGYCQQHVASL